MFRSWCFVVASFCRRFNLFFLKIRIKELRCLDLGVLLWLPSVAVLICFFLIRKKEFRVVGEFLGGGEGQNVIFVWWSKDYLPFANYSPFRVHPAIGPVCPV